MKNKLKKTSKYSKFTSFKCFLYNIICTFNFCDSCIPSSSYSYFVHLNFLWRFFGKKVN